MSWQPYIDNLLQSEKVDKAALVAADGSAIWASSPGFTPSTEELQSIASAFTDPSNLFANGLRVQGQKYFVLKVEERSIYGKLDNDGIIVVKTKQTLLIAHYSHPVSAGMASQVSEAMADYLISVNY